MPFNKLNSASFKCGKVLGKKKKTTSCEQRFGFDSDVFTWNSIGFNGKKIQIKRILQQQN